MNTYRKYLSIAAAILLLVSGMHLYAEQATYVKGKHTYFPNEVLVKYKSNDNTSLTSRKSLPAVQQRRVGSSGDLVRVKATRSRDVAELIAAYQSQSDVAYVQPNYRYQAFKKNIPNDSDYAQQWGLKNTGQVIEQLEYNNYDSLYSLNNAGTAGKDMNLEATWEYISDATRITIAIIDTGVHYSHQDLKKNIWNNSDELAANGVDDDNNGYVDDIRGWDFVEDDNTPQDLEGHGTHVAAIIGARGNNGKGISGVCWKVQLMPLRVLGANGGSTADIVAAIEYAVDNGANIINLSLGAEVAYDYAFSDAITYAETHGVLVVTAAGNGGIDMRGDDVDGGGDDGSSETKVYPACYPHDNIIAVTALDQSYELGYFANYGATSIDLGAPGVNILSLWPGEAEYTSEDFTEGTGWTIKGDWAAQTIDFGIGPYDMLVSPASWNPFTGGIYYEPHSNERAYKTYDFSEFDSVKFSFNVFYDLETDTDFFNIGIKEVIEDDYDPFNEGIVLAQMTGSTLPSFTNFAVFLNDYLFPACSIGFQLRSDGENEYTGVGLGVLEVYGLAFTKNARKFEGGTSMASPQVTGVAALIWAYNPEYTYQDVKQALLAGGDQEDALAETVSRNAVDAYGALTYIKTPVGLTVDKVAH